MSESSNRTNEEDDRPWGGSWTEEKLRVLGDYLSFYLTALKNQRLKLEYVDAFAGAGYRRTQRSQDPGLFALSDEEATAYRSGSARIALSLDPCFDTYTFIEKSRKNLTRLEELASEFQHRDVNIVKGDANEYLQALSSEDWKGRRAVVFVDPYGMQLEWDTLEALARTEAVDVWTLVPISIATNRLLTQKLSDIPKAWARRLDRFFGTEGWREGLYESTEDIKVRKGELSLFPEDEGQASDRMKAVSFDDIAQYYIARLQTVFPHVAKHYKLLRNSTGQPLYMLCFAAANPSPKAGGLALRAANHLLKDNVE